MEIKKGNLKSIKNSNPESPSPRIGKFGAAIRTWELEREIYGDW